MTFYLDVFHPNKEIVTEPKSWVFMTYRKKKWSGAVSAFIVIIMVGGNAGDGFPKQNSNIPETFLHTTLIASSPQQYYNVKYRSRIKAWLVQAPVISQHGSDPLLLCHSGYYLLRLVCLFVFLIGLLSLILYETRWFSFPKAQSRELMKA